MAASEKPLAALPNVGLASLAGQRVVFPHATPEYFANFAAHAQELGARIIGGCCGTTPTQIAAIREAVDGARGQRTDWSYASASSSYGRPSRRRRPSSSGSSTRVSSSSRGDRPPRGGNADAMLELARTLQASGTSTSRT